MRILLGMVLALALAPVVAAAQSQFAAPDHGRLAGSVLECSQGNDQAVPCGITGAPVQVTPEARAPQDCSEILPTPGTPVQLVGSGTPRVSLEIQNLSTTSAAGISNTSSNPVIGSGNTTTLAPLAGWGPPDGSGGAVWAVGSAANQVIHCTLYQ